MIGFYALCGETSRAYTASNFSITPVTLPIISIAIYIGIAYNKSWIVSSISITFGIIYFIVRFLSNTLTASGFQYLVFILCMAVLEMFAIYIFYYNEICLRKNFFNSQLIEEKKSSIKEILNMVPIPIVQSTNGIVTLLNKSIKEMLGITRNEDKEIKDLEKSEREEKYLFYLYQIKTIEENNSFKDLLKNNSTNTI